MGKIRRSEGVAEEERQRCLENVTTIEATSHHLRLLRGVDALVNFGEGISWRLSGTFAVLYICGQGVKASTNATPVLPVGSHSREPPGVTTTAFVRKTLDDLAVSVEHPQRDPHIINDVITRPV